MLATNIGSGMVVGQFGVGVMDGPDLDREPEVIPLAGSITFTPSIPYLPNVTAEPNAITIVTAPIKAVLDEQGYLCTPYPDGVRPMHRGVRLFATDDPDGSVRNWTYSVAYRFAVVNGATPTIPAHAISVPEGAEVDLTRVVDVPSSPGVGTPQALALLALAEEAANSSAGSAAEAKAVALQVKADADAGVFNGKPGPAGPNTVPTQQAVADAILTPGSAAAVALSGTIGDQVAPKLDKAEAAYTFASAKGSRPGNRVVFWGDSITKGADFVAAEVSRGISWPTYASIMSRQRLTYIHNAGVSGDTTTQMIARFQTDVATKQPNVVAIMAGTNDLGKDSPATARVNIAEMVRLVRSIGATPVLFTVLPALGATPANRRAEVIKLNVWLRDFTSRQGLILIDAYAQMVNPATGGFLPAYASADNIHPNAAGYALLGRYVADTLGPLLSHWTPPLPQENLDPNNLIPNGLFLTDSDANGVPDGWSNPAGVTGQTVSLIPGTSEVKGNWFQFDLAATTVDSQLFRAVTVPGLIAGNKYVLLGRVQSENLSGGAAVYARMRWTATANRDDVPMNSLPHNIADGVFYCEVTAPAGVTAAQISLQAKFGTGKIRFAQVGFYNLSSMGVA